MLLALMFMVQYDRCINVHDAVGSDLGIYHIQDKLAGMPPSSRLHLQLQQSENGPSVLVWPILA